jgi:hypothetical protein
VPALDRRAGAVRSQLVELAQHRADFQEHEPQDQQDAGQHQTAGQQDRRRRAAEDGKIDARQRRYQRVQRVPQG